MKRPMYESVDVVAHKSRTPDIRHSVTEFGRAFGEILMLGTLWPVLGGSAAGDDHPVLVLPGFLGSDLSTLIFRRYLQQRGYTPLPWLQGRNTGRESIQSGLLQRFLQVYDEYQCPVSLVGHSLGGVFARELARQHPDKVRCVVCLASPIGTTDGGSVAHIVRSTFEHVAQRSVAELRADLKSLDPRQPPGVPSSAIYSKSDGVVHWQSCLEQASPQTENIEVSGSHCGMVVNPSVLMVVADRLSQPLGGWCKYQHPSAITASRAARASQSGVPI